VSEQDLYRGCCAYCSFATQVYDLLERAESDLLSHAHEKHPEMGEPRVVALRDIERIAQEQGEVSDG